jgi:hypothetical protein
MQSGCVYGENAIGLRLASNRRIVIRRWVERTLPLIPDSFPGVSLTHGPTFHVEREAPFRKRANPNQYDREKPHDPRKSA